MTSDRSTFIAITGYHPAGGGSALKSAAVAIGQALLIALCLYVFLRGWRRSIRVPVFFFFDSLFYLTQGKSTSTTAGGGSIR